MKYLWLAFLLPSLVFAEAMPVSYTEPSGTGFAKTCVYACVQYQASSCTCTPTAVTICTDNQNGGTAEEINVSWDVPIKDGQLPTCINYGVRSLDSEGNASAMATPATGDHVFTEP